MGKKERNFTQNTKNNLPLTFHTKCVIMLSKGSEKMPRTKNLNIVVTYEGTGYVVNDFGIGKSPRFELYHIPTKKSIKKSNDPYDFDDYMWKVWKKEGLIENVQQDFSTEEESN